MISNCRICQTPIKPFMSFGAQPIANGFTPDRDAKNEFFYEMAVATCSDCKMFQLLENPEPEAMFNDSYAFFSGTSQAMTEHFKGFYEATVDRYKLSTQESFVVEIGCNDGILLGNFSDSGYKHLGVEPSGNVADVAIARGINCTKSFFDETLVNKMVDEKVLADLIVSANVICHIPDLNSLASNVAALLAPEGVFVFEEPYLGAMIEKTSYDQIYDEHIYVFSAISLKAAFSRQGLRLIDTEYQITHGGSMRYHFCLDSSSHSEHSRVSNVIDAEVEQGLDKAETYEKFRESCERSKHQLVSLLEKLKGEGAAVCGYGATSKSTTVLNYCGIGPELISFISDTTPIKQGKYTPGMHIPVVKPDVFHSSNPDYAVLFAWNHEKEIMSKEKKLGKSSVKWIRFVPSVEIV
jgi:methylation protein EvaC